MRILFRILDFIFSWPCVVLIIILIFRKDLSGLIKRVRGLKVPGGVLDLSLDERMLPESRTLNVPNVSILKEKPGNLFWAGYDLMWTILNLLTSENKALQLHGFRHALFHLEELGLKSTTTYNGIETLKRLVEGAQVLDPSERYAYANKLNSLAVQTGRSIESLQPDFKGTPDPER